MTPTQPTATTTEALRLPEGTLSMQGNDITIAYATREDAERAFDVLEAALSTAPSGDGVPGMVLVPVDPTPGMILAFHAAINRWMAEDAEEDDFASDKRVWQAMLSAALSQRGTDE